MKCSFKIGMTLWGGSSLNGTLKWVMFILVLAIQNNKKLSQNKTLPALLSAGVDAAIFRTEDAQEQPSSLSRCNSPLSVDSETDKQSTEVDGKAVLGKVDFPSGSSAELWESGCGLGASSIYDIITAS